MKLAIIFVLLFFHSFVLDPTKDTTKLV